MNHSAVRIIEKKINKKALHTDEIHFFIKKMTAGEIPDYQTTALLTAIFLNGMTPQEIADLTHAMVLSGKKLNFKSVPGQKVDKHSTGGIGDKVSIILAPLAAACGLAVPMMAGRGLGFSGGTLDKLESIPGFQVGLSEKESTKILKKIGCFMIGQTKDIAPADRTLYALRDVTATVESIPLIVASILSKKIAEGSNLLIMDIKVGSGAFMKTLSKAEQLSKMLIQVGKINKLKVRCLLTNMNQPLGYSAGNALEVLECIEILKNEKPKDPTLQNHDLIELTLQLCAHMLYISKKTPTLKKGYHLAKQKLTQGDAWLKFLEMTRLQKGNLSLFLKKNHKTRFKTVILSPKSGYLQSFLLDEIGYFIVDLGGGRKKTSDTIDPEVGIYFHKKIGDSVQKNEPIATLFYNHKISDLNHKFLKYIFISNKKTKPHPLIFKTITS